MRNFIALQIINSVKFILKITLVIVPLLLVSSCLTETDYGTFDTDITSEYLVEGLANENLDVFYEGDEVFRKKGKPGTETFFIGTGDLALYENCFVLFIANGDEGVVSSAIIKFNGVEILNTSDFSGAFAEYKFEICNLTAESTLSVEIRGEPGTSLDIWIEGRLKDEDPFAGDAGTFTDRGIVYNWVRIGEQIWMAENLAFDTGDGCWAYNNDESNVTTYGRLYTWDAAVANCPEDWHLPSDAEWEELAAFNDSEQGNLSTYPDGWQVASYLKAESGWDNNGNGTDDYGFSALPGGLHSPYAHESEFDLIGEAGSWWSSTTTGYPTDRRYWGLDWYATTLYRSARIIATGQSVRYVLDTP